MTQVAVNSASMLSSIQASRVGPTPGYVPEVTQRTFTVSLQFVRVLNTGSTATVYEARDKTTGIRVAVKLIKRTELTEFIVQREIHMQRGLQHDNIVRAFKCIETPSHFLILEELMEGGDLFDAITTHNNISESTIMQWIKGVLSALVYLHDRDIVHRDVKLENVMIANQRTNRVKLIDFGFASEATGASKTVPGTEEYVAPELLSGHIDTCLKKSDVWATGILLWALLSKGNKTSYDFPWHRADASSASFCKYMQGDLSFEPWNSFSSPAKFLLLNMLAINHTSRCTAAEALQFVSQHWTV